MSYYIRLNKAKTRYYGIVYYVDRDGKRHQKSTPTFQYKREAKEKAIQLEDELNRLDVDLKDISLYDYYIRWYELYKRGNLSQQTKNRYENIGRVIQGYFKDTRMRDVKRTDFQKFINWYGDNHARDSVQKLMNAIKKCVSYAMDDDILLKDFTNNTKMVYDKGRMINVEYLNHDEIETLIQATKAGLSPHFTSRYMILTAIFTGMSKSEIQAITWKDIDFLHSTISITKSWDDVGKYFKDTKTDASSRTIKVNPEMLKLLKELQVNQSIMVFQNIQGTVPTSNALNKCLRSTMDKAGISKQGFHFHSLRHVHVAYLLSQGVDIYAISKRLGHSNITITLDTYSYLIDEYKAKNDDTIINQLAKLI